VINPHHFHLYPLKIVGRYGLHSFDMHTDVRELMKIYRMLRQRGEKEFTQKIEKLLNSLANNYGYNEFNIDEKITMRKNNIGVRTDG